MSSLNTRDRRVDANIAATTAAFTLQGGRYALTVIGTITTSVTLQRLAADGSTYVTAATAFTAAGYQVSDLAQGTYRWAISSATGVYAEIESIAVPLA